MRASSKSQRSMNPGTAKVSAGIDVHVRVIA